MNQKTLVIVLALLAFALACLGQSERQRISYQGFGGGMFTQADINKCLPGQMLKACNVVIGDEGEVKRRPAFVQHTGGTGIGFKSSTSPIAMIQTTSDYMFVADNSVVKMIASSGAETVVYGSDCNTTKFVVFDDYVVFHLANGGSALLCPTASVASATTATGSPTISTLIVHNNRLFGGYNQTLYESSVGSTTWTDGEAWVIGSGDASTAEQITGLGSLRGILYIFMKNKIYRMTGYSPEERRVELFSASFGTLEHRTIVNCELTGLGEAILFYSTAGKICALTESGIQEISEAVSLSLYDPIAEYSSALRQYWIVNSASINRGYVICLDQPYQSQGGTRWPITQIPCDDIPLKEAFTSVAKVVSTRANTDSHLGQLLVAVMAKPGASTTSVICHTSESAYYDTWYDYASAAYQNQTITSTIKTRHEDAGDERVLKGWKKAFFWFSGTSPVATVTQITDYKTATTTYFSAFNSDTTASRTALNMYNWSARNSLNMQFDAAGPWILHRLDMDFVKGAKYE